jgi:hypothetical protein
MPLTQISALAGNPHPSAAVQEDFLGTILHSTISQWDGGEEMKRVNRGIIRRRINM